MKAEEGMKGCQRLHSHEGCADIMHELRKVGQVPLLTSRPGSREPAQGMTEGLVVVEKEELPALQHKPDVSNHGLDAVASLSRHQLLEEEGERGPGPYIIFSKNPCSWADGPAGGLNILKRPQHRFLATLWHKKDVFDEKKGVWGS